MNGQMIRGAAAMNQDTAGAKYAEPTMTPIPGALDRLMSAAMNLDGTLGTLHDRLYRVLRDAPPAKGEGANGIGAAPPVSSQVYQQIEMQTARLEQMSSFVRDIMDRLEA